MLQDKSATSSILDSIKAAFKARDTSQLGKLLARLIEVEPSRWITFLYLNRIIPNPINRDFSESIGFLFDTLKVALSEDSFKAEFAHNLVLPLFSLNLSFNSIREELEQLETWKDGGVTTILRVAAFLEDQQRISFDKTQEKIRKDGFVFTHLATLGDDFPTLTRGSNASRLAAYETNCEILQLILSYSIHKYGNDFSNEPIKTISPYNDAEFTKLLVLASNWRMYEFLWELIVFSGWLPTHNTEVKDLLVYAPQNLEEFKNFEIGGIREQEIIIESMGALSVIPKYPAEQMGKLIQSINPPRNGEFWDGNIDLNAIIEVANNLSISPEIDEKIIKNHYEEIIQEVTFGEKTGGIPWSVYIKSINTLSILCEAFNDAIGKQNPTEVNEFSRLIIATKPQLENLLSATTNINIEECSQIVKALTFNPTLHNMEIWDLPLIGIGNDCYLLIPSIIQPGNRIRAIENAISEWNENLFQKRGKSLEKSMKLSLEEMGLKVESPIKFTTDMKEEIECDLVMYWDGYVVIIEAKCTKSIYTGSELYRGKKNLEEAVIQLNKRQVAIINNWEAFRATGTKLSLPSQPIKPERIIKIAITNVLAFSGTQVDDVIITDEYCFKRFFGEADMELIQFSQQKGMIVSGSVGRIRKSDEITAHEFFMYLKNPPQINMVKECLKPKIMILPKFKKTDPNIGMLHFRYDPKNLRVVKASKKILGIRKNKHRRRHQKK